MGLCFVRLFLFGVSLLFISAFSVEATTLDQCTDCLKTAMEAEGECQIQKYSCDQCIPYACATACDPWQSYKPCNKISNQEG